MGVGFCRDVSNEGAEVVTTTPAPGSEDAGAKYQAEGSKAADEPRISIGSDESGGEIVEDTAVFLHEFYPGIAAEKVSGHRPQIMFSGHVKRGLDPSEVVDHLISRQYRALLNIQESWEPDYQDLEEAATQKGVVYVHLPVPKCVQKEEGDMHEAELTLELARQIGLVVLALPRPLMILSHTAKRASAVWFFNYVVKQNLSSAQVMMLTASANLSFAKHPPLLFWMGRFMMMVDTERSRNRQVFGDQKFEGANEVESWDPARSPSLEAGMIPRNNSKDSGGNRRPPGEIPRLPSKDSGGLKGTRVTGPDGNPQTFGDTLGGWTLPSPSPFSDVVFPGFIDSEMGGLGRGDDSAPQTTFGRFRLGGFAQFKAASWLVKRQYRSVLNLGHPEDIDFIDFGGQAREVGLQYMHIPVEDGDLISNEYPLNLARIIALSILGMPRPLMIVSGGMRRASVAWLFAHATRWEVGSACVQNLALSPALTFTVSPKLRSWVERFMQVADAAIARGEKVMGDIEICGESVPQWHLDLSTKPDTPAPASNRNPRPSPPPLKLPEAANSSGK